MTDPRDMEVLEMIDIPQPDDDNVEIGDGQPVGSDLPEIEPEKIADAADLPDDVRDGDAGVGEEGIE